MLRLGGVEDFQMGVDSFFYLRGFARGERVDSRLARANAFLE